MTAPGDLGGFRVRRDQVGEPGDVVAGAAVGRVRDGAGVEERVGVLADLVNELLRQGRLAAGDRAAEVGTSVFNVEPEVAARLAELARPDPGWELTVRSRPDVDREGRVVVDVRLRRAAP